MLYSNNLAALTSTTKNAACTVGSQKTITIPGLSAHAVRHEKYGQSYPIGLVSASGVNVHKLKYSSTLYALASDPVIALGLGHHLHPTRKTDARSRSKLTRASVSAPAVGFSVAC